MKKTTLAMIISSAMLIQGCSTHNSLGDPLKEVEQQDSDIRSFLKEEFRYTQKQYGYNKGIDVLGDSFEIKQTQPLPPVFDTPTNIGKLDALPLEEILERVNRYYQRFGVVVTVAPDAEKFLGGRTTGSGSETELTASDSTQQSAVVPIAQVAASGLTTRTESRYNYKMTMDFRNSSLRQILDLISANTGLWWEYKNGVAFMRHTKEETFPIDVGDKSYTLETGSDGSAMYSVSTASDSESPLSGIEKQINQYLSENGSVAVNKFDKSVTVKDTPLNISRVQEFIEKTNHRAMTTYAIKTEVYEVVWDRNDNKQVDWSASFTDALTSITGSAPPVVDTTNFGGVTAQRMGGKWDGSRMVANFINTNSSLVTKIVNEGKTKNNTPVQLIASEDRAIVSGRSVTIDANGFSQQQTETKLLNEGFSIIALPRLASSGLVDMEMIVNTGNIKDVRTFGDENEQLQLEEMKNHNIIGSIPTRSGETTIINAYTRDLTEGELSALTENFPWWTGGGNSKRRYQTSLVILVTPYILER